MDNLTNIGTIKDILSRHGFTFSKSLGQNFLINPSVCPKMAQNANIDENTGVIEIGPGIGVLTNELLKLSKKVVAIELDKRLIPVLDETLSEYSNLKIINDDVMKIDLKKLIAEEFEGMKVVVCANLPYYITSPVIMRLLEEKLRISSITVMVQKEAALRLCADLGTRESSAVTVAVNYYSRPEFLFNVSSGSFMPAPRVDSAVIRLDIFDREQKPIDEKLFFKVVKGAFIQRRKTLSNSLSSYFKMDKTAIGEILNKVKLDTNIRAESLNIEDFILVSDLIYNYNKQNNQI